VTKETKPKHPEPKPQKPNPEKEDRRLSRLTAICLALPQTSRQCHGSHAAFHVGKKIFAYFLNDHHGDGIVAVTCKVLPGDNAALAAAGPQRFYPPAYLASRGWVALRLDFGDVDWGEVTELVMTSYRLIAPKRLAAQVVEATSLRKRTRSKATGPFPPDS
jgi:predicted DNA-binding protein (MmcQ/YjbR family)